jgi:hypothetical protein
MTAAAQATPDFDGPEDRQLADDIARAMHHRPLLSRLSRVDAIHGDTAASLIDAMQSAPKVKEIGPLEAAPPLGELRSLEEVIDDLGNVAGAPPSAKWLENARQANRQKRVSHVVAWLTTLAIAVSIVGLAALLFRA